MRYLYLGQKFGSEKKGDNLLHVGSYAVAKTFPPWN